MGTFERDQLRTLALRAVEQHLDVDGTINAGYPTLAALIRQGIPPLECVQALQEEYDFARSLRRAA